MVIHQFYYDVAPMELNKLCKEKFYFDVALMELNKHAKKSSIMMLLLRGIFSAMKIQ